jgi:hypothetical protein
LCDFVLGNPLAYNRSCLMLLEQHGLVREKVHNTL